jgi:hypothetical protein
MAQASYLSPCSKRIRSPDWIRKYESLVECLEQPEGAQRAVRKPQNPPE